MSDEAAPPGEQLTCFERPWHNPGPLPATFPAASQLIFYHPRETLIKGPFVEGLLSLYLTSVHCYHWTVTAVVGTACPLRERFRGLPSGVCLPLASGSEFSPSSPDKLSHPMIQTLFCLFLAPQDLLSPLRSLLLCGSHVGPVRSFITASVFP